MTGRIVVFGGGGFVGTAIVRRLGDGVLAPPRSTVDLENREELARFLRPGDVVVNAAGYASATDLSVSGLARLRRDNVDAVRNLASAATEAGVDQLIHLSSVAAMGQRSGLGLTEDDLAPPRSPYGSSKRDAEVVLDEFAADLPCTILRPTSVFGETRGLTAVLCKVAMLPVIPLPGSGASLIPLSYVGNLAEAVTVSIGRPACLGRTFIVGDDRSYDLRSVLERLAAALRGRRPAVVPLPRTILSAVGSIETSLSRAVGRRPLLDRVRVETLTSSISFSTEAFREATGFTAPYSLEAGLDLVAAAHRARRGPHS